MAAEKSPHSGVSRSDGQRPSLSVTLSEPKWALSELYMWLVFEQKPFRVFVLQGKDTPAPPSSGKAGLAHKSQITDINSFLLSSPLKITPFPHVSKLLKLFKMAVSLSGQSSCFM